MRRVVDRAHHEHGDVPGGRAFLEIGEEFPGLLAIQEHVENDGVRELAGEGAAGFPEASCGHEPEGGAAEVAIVDGELARIVFHDEHRSP